MTPELALKLIITAVTVPALAVGLRAVRVEVRDNMDEFINDIRRQGRWASWASFLAAASTVLQMVLMWVQ